jgi:uncharacterized protein YbjT (DUF2867 family)
MTSSVALNAMYVILGASGNTGSIIADSLLSKGKKVRVVGRDAGRLQRFVRQGAEAFTGDVSDAAALTKAFTGAQHTYCCRRLPPGRTKSERAMRSRKL